MDIVIPATRGSVYSAQSGGNNIAFMAVPLALVWLAVSLWLGRQHDKKLAKLESADS